MVVPGVGVLAEFQDFLAADDAVVEATALLPAELGQPVGWVLTNWMAVAMWPQGGV